MKSPTLLLAALLLCACEQAEPQPPPSAQPVAFGEAMASMNFADEYDVPAEERADAIKAALTTAFDITSRSRDWREAVDLADRAIQQAEPGVERSRVEQTAAKIVLQAYLVPNADQDGAGDQALRFSQLLIERGTPEASAMLETVQAFQNVWTETETRTISLGAAEAAESFTRKYDGCVDCGMPGPLQQDLSERGQASDVSRTVRVDAIRQLREIAN